MADKPHVVILGAGFAGLGALKKLAKAPVSITLIDRNDYHTFLPLLYQVATAELGPHEVGFPVSDMLDNHGDSTFHQATVAGIDLAAKTVTAEGVDPISYDYLVVALGAVVNFFGTTGAAEHAFPLYTMDDAVRLQTHILSRLSAVDTTPALADEGALTFCVVGGGATGVEISGALAEFLRAELKQDYPNVPIEKAEVHLYELGPSLLAPFKPELQNYAKAALEERGVQVHLGEGVVEIEETGVHLKSGGTIAAHTLVWGAGLMANPLVQSMGVELEKGRAKVAADLSLPDHPEVFVIGDIAMITDTSTNRQLPQLGSVALQAGEQAGENIERLVHGKKSEPFKYTDKGTMATVGHGAAVVEFQGGRTMTGEAAWLAWLGVHLVLLSGGQQKALTFVDWGWNVLSGDRGKGLAKREHAGTSAGAHERAPHDDS